MVMVLRIGRVRVRVGVSLTFCVPPRQVVTSLESLHSSASPTPTAPVGLVVALQPGFGSVGSIAAKHPAKRAVLTFRDEFYSKLGRCIKRLLHH